MCAKKSNEVKSSRSHPRGPTPSKMQQPRPQRKTHQQGSYGKVNRSSIGKKTNIPKIKKLQNESESMIDQAKEAIFEMEEQSEPIQPAQASTDKPNFSVHKVIVPTLNRVYIPTPLHAQSQSLTSWCPSQIRTNKSESLAASKPSTENKMFHCRKYTKVSEVDFDIYTHSLSKTKIYSTILLNEFGRFIYVNKLGNEQIEGSLNNLSKISLSNIILQSQKVTLLRRMQFINFQEGAFQILKFFIYSKNAKRRYNSFEFLSVQENIDLFYRYLKCLSGRIRAIELQLQNYRKYEGFWNPELITANKPIRCFLLECRLSRKIPFSLLQTLNLKNDRIIRKFITSTRKKQLKSKHNLTLVAQTANTQGTENQQNKRLQQQSQQSQKIDQYFVKLESENITKKDLPPTQRKQNQVCSTKIQQVK